MRHRRPRWLGLGAVFALEAAGYAFLFAVAVAIVRIHA